MSKKRFLAWSVIPVCLFLISMGIKLPNLASLHTAPKPRPRAVIETTSKTCQHATTNNVLAVALRQPSDPATPESLQITASSRDLSIPLDHASPDRRPRSTFPQLLIPTDSSPVTK